MKTTELSSTALRVKIDDETAPRSLKLHQRSIYPVLAVICVGEPVGPFVDLKKKRAKSLGIEVSVYQLPATASKKTVQESITWLNNDPEVHGIIIQLPLPKQFKTAEVTELLGLVNASKDVDGLGKGALKMKPAGNVTALEKQAISADQYLPTTAWSMLKIVEEYNLATKNVLLIGNGRLVGQPLKRMLQALKIKLTQVEKDDDVNKALFKSDLVLIGTDATKSFIDDSFTKEGAALIAAGVELDHENLDGYAGAMTPAKGGVGPLTISLLLQNVIRAAENQTKAKK